MEDYEMPAFLSAAVEHTVEVVNEVIRSVIL